MNSSSFTSIARSVSGRFLAAAGLAFALLPTARAAVTWHDVQFGGFLSQGFLANTGSNDYLGDTSDGTFDFREYAVNASYAIGKWRVGAQAFGQKLGEYGDDKIKLDWATIDYQPTQWLGFRVGRVKTPRGLYNEALDIDSVRPFVLLPQSVYDARLRDFNSAFNGGMLYGNVALGKAGSIDYKVFYGDIPMSTSSGASAYFNNDAPYNNSRFEMDAVYGGSLFWNPAMAGLRLGYSYSGFKNFGADRIISFAPLPVFRDSPLYQRHLISIEYTRGDWTFASEAGWERAHFDIGLSGQAAQFTQEVRNTYGYVSAARRINPWLELGSYFSYSKDTDDFDNPDPAAHVPDLTQRDFALSAKFDVTEHLIFKIEGHYLDGAGKLFDTADHPQPVASRDQHWALFTAKVTFSF
jgi:hypothetical protein